MKVEKVFEVKVTVRVRAESKFQVENAIHDMLIHWPSQVAFLGWEVPNVDEIEETEKEVK